MSGTDSRYGTPCPALGLINCTALQDMVLTDQGKCADRSYRSTGFGTDRPYGATLYGAKRRYGATLYGTKRPYGATLYGTNRAYGAAGGDGSQLHALSQHFRARAGAASLSLSL
eukprot:1343270-Rhodomonas_salina.1